MSTASNVAQSETETAQLGGRNRWRSILAVLFAAGMLLAWQVQRAVITAVSGDPPRLSIPRDRFDVSIPNTQLTPEQVVERQVISLQAAMLDNECLVECYSFAAPSNRAATGPFENFSALVRTEPFIELGRCSSYQIGSAVIDGDAAAVLVSLLTDQDQSMAFRFMLAKQTQAPYEGCWMTEGVFPLVQGASIPNAAAAAQDAPIVSDAEAPGGRVD